MQKIFSNIIKSLRPLAIIICIIILSYGITKWGLHIKTPFFDDFFGITSLSIISALLSIYLTLTLFFITWLDIIEEKHKFSFKKTQKELIQSFRLLILLFMIHLLTAIVEDSTLEEVYSLSDIVFTSYLSTILLYIYTLYELVTVIFKIQKMKRQK